MTFEERLEELKKDFEERLEELKKDFEEKDKGCNSWAPKFGETYWYLSNGGSIFSDNWTDNIIDIDRLNIGNVFKTQEEAQFELERLRVLAEMKKYSKPFEIRGNNFVIKYVHQENSIKIGGLGETQYNDIYFENEEIAQKVIDEVGVDRIKKYYLRVE